MQFIDKILQDSRIQFFVHHISMVSFQSTIDAGTNEASCGLFHDHNTIEHHIYGYYMNYFVRWMYEDLILMQHLMTEIENGSIYVITNAYLTSGLSDNDINSPQYQQELMMKVKKSYGYFGYL